MENDLEQPQFLSVPEAAKLCGVSRNTVFTWVKKGKLHAYQTPGRTNLIRPADLVNFMEESGMYVPPALYSQAREDKRMGPAGETQHGETGLDSLLIVDDEAIIRNMVVRSLKDVCPVYQAETGFEALHFLTLHQEIQIVLLDLHMPGQHGLETLEQITNLRPDVKVVILTGFDTEISHELLEADRIAALITKPFNPPELQKLVSGMLDEANVTD